MFRGVISEPVSSRVFGPESCPVRSLGTTTKQDFTMHDTELPRLDSEFFQD